MLERSAAFDRIIALARCAATAFFVIGAVVEPGDDLFLTVVIGVALCIGSLLGILAQRDWRNRPSFGVISFLFDGTIITLLLVDARSNPFEVVYSAALLVVCEGGARWGRNGGIVAGLWMGTTVAVWTADVQQRAGLDLGAEPLLQRFGLFMIIGWGIGTMIHRLQEQRSAIQRVVDSSHDGMLTVGPEGSILSGNESAELVLGQPAAVLVGSPFDDLIVPAASGLSALEELRKGDACELELASDPGRWTEALLTDVPDLGYAFVVCRDVTARATRTRRLAHDAHHDELTRLANRRRLMQELSSALDPRRSSQTISLLLVDLDDFKRVNDTLGHLVGDELLVALADRLGRLVRPSDVAVRLGGDEFAILMRNTHGAAPAAHVAPNAFPPSSVSLSTSAQRRRR